jgi:hypothetical protein
MAKFKVGDVCVIVGAISYPELVGKEVTITGLPYWYKSATTGKPTLGYKTDRIYGGMHISPPEEFLKLKKFPGEDSIMRLFSQPIKEVELA